MLYLIYNKQPDPLSTLSFPGQGINCLGAFESPSDEAAMSFLKTLAVLGWPEKVYLYRCEGQPEDARQELIYVRSWTPFSTEH